MSAYIQSGLALVLVIVFIFLFVWLRRFARNPRAVINKEGLIRAARQHIESASNKVVIFSNDLSWANDYADALRSRILASCEVIVLHKHSIVPRVTQNAKLLRDLGAKVIELDSDHRLRATLIDPDDPDTARLFVAHKRRRPGSASAIESGETGTGKDFHYECGV